MWRRISLAPRLTSPHRRALRPPIHKKLRRRTVHSCIPTGPPVSCLRIPLIRTDSQPRWLNSRPRGSGTQSVWPRPRLAISHASQVSAIASARAVGVAVPDSTEAAHDRRFSNEFWANNPFFYGLRGAYDALAEYADAVLAIGLEDLDPVVARKAEFAVRAGLRRC